MTANGQLRDYARIERAIRFLEAAADEKPSLAAVAAEIGLSPFHFHRLFSRFAGVSPKRFLAYLSLAHARATLGSSESVLAAALDSGLSGPSRLHDLFVTFEAMTPGEYRRLGAGLEIRHGFHPTPFGRALLLTSPRGLVGLSFVTERGDDFALREQAGRWPMARLIADSRATGDLARRIFARVASNDTPLPALVPGTNFQIKVWEALLRTPEGALVSYNQLGAAIGLGNAPRAIGNALAANPLAYLIPCHRVIRQTGALNDYRWGVERKRAIIAWEAARGPADRRA
ncbi:MAG: methylated-DNA--[protein]-cysteine S-methyltransferase [Rhodospirillales bacterium]|nr:methylated-DNA--[protein]-cysteine S-methyltransferase [Rhodospirillales bacterium]MSP79820.1 methylated-DNA--[protein]-cysteine S-methyltransferase [Rhodospirillales bacterium]